MRILSSINSAGLRKINLICDKLNMLFVALEDHLVKNLFSDRLTSAKAGCLSATMEGEKNWIVVVPYRQAMSHCCDTDGKTKQMQEERQVFQLDLGRDGHSCMGL